MGTKYPLPDRIEPGQIWECMDEHDRKRGHGWIKILETEVHGTGPAWTYCSSGGVPEADGIKHPDWFWHYSDVLDFVVYGRFRWVAPHLPPCP